MTYEVHFAIEDVATIVADSPEQAAEMVRSDEGPQTTIISVLEVDTPSDEPPDDLEPDDDEDDFGWGHGV